MKKIFIAVLILVAVVNSTQAKSFDTETKTVSLSAGFASRYGGVPIVLSFEHNLLNINDDMGIRVGGIFGWSTAAYDYVQLYEDNGGLKWANGKNRYHNISMAFRGSYYYTGFKNFDLYASILTGYNVQTGRTVWDSKSDKNKFGDRSTPDSKFLFGVVAGVRYEFTENIGAFVESGYGLSYVSVGVSYRFRKQFFGQK